MEEDTIENRTESHGYSYKLNDFEGPLDVLIYLIRKNEINIYDIPISSITEQFLEWIAQAESVGLEDLTEFYALAGDLLYIKSRMLLPVEVNLADELEDPRKNLVEKIIEYQKFKKLSELMEQKELEAEWTIERHKMQRTLPFADDDNMWEKVDVWVLLKAFSNIVGPTYYERVFDLTDEVDPKEKHALILELLETKGVFDFKDLITKPNSLADFISAFMAILEAVKYRVISIHQHKLFGDIQIRKYEGGNFDGPKS